MSRSTGLQKKSLISTGLSHICQDGLGAATYVLLPIIAQAFGLSYAQVGFIKGAKSLALSLLELVSGFLSESFGESRVLVAGLLVAGTGYAALATADTTTIIVCCLIVVGVGGGLHHAPASSLVSRTYEHHNRRSALGIYNASGDVGKLLFTAIFSIAIAVGIAWEQVVFSYGLIALLSALVVGYTMSVSGIHAERAGCSSAKANTDSDARGWGVQDVPQFSLLLVVVFLDNIVQVGVLVFVAFLMIAKELPLYLATFATALVLVGGVFGKAGCGYLAQNMGVRRAFVLVQVLTAIGLLAIVAAPSWLAFVILLPFGVVSQGSTTITYGLLPDYIHPERMARGYSILYSSSGFAAVLGPWIIGALADFYSIEFAFGFMTVAALLSLAPLAFSTKFAKTA